MGNVESDRRLARLSSPRTGSPRTSSPRFDNCDSSQRITFDYSDESSELGFLQYIPVAKPETAIANLCRAEEIVTPAKIKILFAHPLKNKFIAKFEQGPYTRAELAKLICDQYAKIYEEEQQTSTISVEALCPQTTNCCETNGKYKLWGYGIEYLLLHAVHIDKIYTLDIRTE